MLGDVSVQSCFRALTGSPPLNPQQSFHSWIPFICMLSHTFRMDVLNILHTQLETDCFGSRGFSLRKNPLLPLHPCPLRRRSRLLESPGCEHQKGPQNVFKSSSIIYRGGTMFSRSKDYPKPYDLLLTTQATGPSYTFAGRERSRGNLQPAGVNS